VVNNDFVNMGSIITATLQMESYFPLIRKYARGRLMDCGCMKVPFYEIYRDIVSEVYCVDMVPNEY
jgi:hypothetical protein